MNSGTELDRLGLCRMGSDENGWHIGTLIRYRGTSSVQCCLRESEWSEFDPEPTVNGNIPGCRLNDGMDYSKLPYQMLWAGDCQ